jgi:signal transduction histidine kinase
MLRTLRGRLALSHMLPLLVIIPLLGIALIYVLETQFILPSFAKELEEDAALLASVLRREPDIWNDTASAQKILAQVNPRATVRAMLLDPRGRVLASTDPADADRLGQPLADLDLHRALEDGITSRTEYSLRLKAEITDVMAPVVGADNKVLGIVRLSHELTAVQEGFRRLRILVLGVLAVGLGLGAAVGLVLATQLGEKIRRVTRAVYELASDQRSALLPEHGPEEMALLSHAVNILAERRRSVERTNRQLISSLVHELGRPLGAFYAAIQALEDGAYEDEALREQLLSGIQAEVQSLSRLLDDLSQLHDRVIGQFELQRRSVDLGEWLGQTLGPWRESAKAQRLDWQASVVTDLPTLQIDPDRLSQALGNVLSNAIKYTPPGGQISVTAGADHSEVWIQVSDTGSGIAPEDLAHIFAPFYRAQRTDAEQQGSGLGLAITHSLVAAHGGRVAVESTLGVGSRFTIWLPLVGVDSNRGRVEQCKTPNASRASSGHRI